jgi:hypothetical protein
MMLALSQVKGDNNCNSLAIEPDEKNCISK